MYRTNKQQVQYKEDLMKMTSMTESQATKEVEEYINTVDQIRTDPVLLKTFQENFDENLSKLVKLEGLRKAGFTSFTENAHVLLQDGDTTLVKDLVSKIDPDGKINTSYLFEQVFPESSMKEIQDLIQSKEILGFDFKAGEAVTAMTKKGLEDVKQIESDIQAVKKLTTELTAKLKENKMLHLFKDVSPVEMQLLATKFPPAIRTYLEEYQRNKSLVDLHSKKGDVIKATASAKAALNNLSMFVNIIDVNKLLDAEFLPDFSWNESLPADQNVAKIVNLHKELSETIKGEELEMIYSFIFQDILQTKRDAILQRAAEKNLEYKTDEAEDAGLTFSEARADAEAGAESFEERKDIYATPGEDRVREFDYKVERAIAIMENVYDIDLEGLPPQLVEYIALTFINNNLTSYYLDNKEATLSLRNIKAKAASDFVKALKGEFAKADEDSSLNKIENFITESAENEVYKYNLENLKLFLKENLPEKEVNSEEIAD